MIYAHIVNNAIEAVGRLPRGGDADGQWIEPLTVDNAHLAGWLPVVDTARPADTATHTTDRSVELVAGQPTVVWTARAKSAGELAADTATANDTTIRDQAATALAANRAFLADESLTNAEVVAQVRSLTRQVSGIARLTLGLLDAVD